MRRILQMLTVAIVIGAIMATSGTSAGAQSPCPPTGPSNGPATLMNLDEPRWAGFVCLDEVDQRFFCPPGFEHWLFRNPPGSRSPFQSECVELSPSSIGGVGGVEPTQSGEQAESAPAESAPAESALAESTPAESTPATTAGGGIAGFLLEAYDTLKAERRLIGVGIIALTLIGALLMAWMLPMRRNVEDPPETARGAEGESRSAASSSASGPPPEEATPESGVSSSPAARGAEEDVVAEGSSDVAEGGVVAASDPGQERLRRGRPLRRFIKNRRGRGI